MSGRVNLFEEHRPMTAGTGGQDSRTMINREGKDITSRQVSRKRRPINEKDCIKIDGRYRYRSYWSPRVKRWIPSLNG